MSKPISVTVNVRVPAKLVEHVGRLGRLALFTLASHPVALVLVPHKWQGIAQGVYVGAMEVAYRVVFPTQPEPKQLEAAAEKAHVPTAAVDEAAAVVKDAVHVAVPAPTPAPVAAPPAPAPVGVPVAPDPPVSDPTPQPDTSAAPTQPS